MARIYKKGKKPKKREKLLANESWRNKGIDVSPGMLKELKKLGISAEDLLKIKSSGMGTHYNIPKA
tara:strand:+ start:2004 stop:2201 length:198 start_codon:yes stop_codon:yes gene_type:complete